MCVRDLRPECLRVSLSNGVSSFLGWIYERLSALGELDRLLTYQPPKDWRPGGFTGPRQLVRQNV